MAGNTVNRLQGNLARPHHCGPKWLLLGLCLLAGALGTACTGEVDSASDAPDYLPWQAPVPSDTSTCKGDQCAASGVPGACAVGLQPCPQGCVDAMSDPSHCGGCGMACQSDEICDLGECRTANSAHCLQTCGGGRSCVEGQCICPTTATSCGEVCTDLESDPTHCGGCFQACGADETCQGGQCVCLDDHTLCDAGCVDTGSDPMHCGGCGLACFAGENCVDGECDSPPGPDGCTVRARDIRIRELAVYQTVKVPLLEAGTPIPEAQRVADVVEGRPTLFRVFVDVEPGFVTRQLSARLSLINDASSETYFDKRQVNGSSSEASLASTFQVTVPAEAVRTDTRYRVDLVECEADSSVGMLLEPGFPKDADDAPLDARRTGKLRISLVPVLANGRLPDTSEAALSVYREYLLATYPASDVELSVTDSISTGYPIDWGRLLNQVATKRSQDNPAYDVYYYGLVQPTATSREYCRLGCTAGVAYVGRTNQPSTRAAVGLAYADEDSAEVMGHEVGHNHGRNHAPCAPGVIDGVDNSFPHAGGGVGVWGYDMRSGNLIDPGRATDIMGYCNSKWHSEYTYNGLTNRIAALHVSGMQLGMAEVGRWQVLYVDAQGMHWELPLPEPAEAYGDPYPAKILGLDGRVIEKVTVYRNEIPDLEAAHVLVPEPRSGWFAVQLEGQAPMPFASLQP